MTRVHFEIILLRKIKEKYYERGYVKKKGN